MFWLVFRAKGCQRYTFSEGGGSLRHKKAGILMPGPKGSEDGEGQLRTLGGSVEYTRLVS